jgi:hypothetical protein
MATIIEPVTRTPDTRAVGAAFLSGYADCGFALYGLGDLKQARLSCETQREQWYAQQCLAMVYDWLGLRSEAQGELAKLRTQQEESAAYQISTVYAQWGDRAQALQWLETAARSRDPGVGQLKTDSLLDPLREEPRFRPCSRLSSFRPDRVFPHNGPLSGPVFLAESGPSHGRRFRNTFET